MTIKWSEAFTTETSALVEKLTVSNRQRIQRAIDAGGFHGALLATRLTERQAREASRKPLSNSSSKSSISWGNRPSRT